MVEDANNLSAQQNISKIAFLIPLLNPSIIPFLLSRLYLKLFLICVPTSSLPLRYKNTQYYLYGNDMNLLALCLIISLVTCQVINSEAYICNIIHTSDCSKRALFFV